MWSDIFLQENDLKRARALKKTKAEQELGRQKDKEIDRLSQEIRQLRSVVTEQKTSISRYKIYQKFMERVLDYSDEVGEGKSFQNSLLHDNYYHCVV